MLRLIGIVARESVAIILAFRVSRVSIGTTLCTLFAKLRFTPFHLSGRNLSRYDSTKSIVSSIRTNKRRELSNDSCYSKVNKRSVSRL